MSPMTLNRDLGVTSHSLPHVLHNIAGANNIKIPCNIQCCTIVLHHWLGTLVAFQSDFKRNTRLNIGMMADPVYTVIITSLSTEHCCFIFTTKALLDNL